MGFIFGLPHSESAISRMDELDEREAFFRAIFADPGSDLPRLVFADWLDEHGESNWAELIRLQCQSHLPSEQPESVWQECLERERQLVGSIPRFAALLGTEQPQTKRGFIDNPVLTCTVADLLDAENFRRMAILEHPEWYGCTTLKIIEGLITGLKPIQTILTSPVTQNVTTLDLSGKEVDLPPVEQTEIALREYELRPVITMQAVQALVESREARRLVTLDLRNNDLDNDAARAVANSSNLIRLKSLHLYEGNQLRGRTWRQLLQKFGPDVLQ